MKIGLDFDEVIANPQKVKALIAKSLWGIDIAPEQFYRNIVLPQKLLPKEHYEIIQQLLFETDEWGLQMEPIPGAIEGIHALLEQGHDVMIITSRFPAGVQVAEAWLNKYLGQPVRVIGVGYTGTKDEAAKTENLDAFVDDSTTKLEPLEGIVQHLFLFTSERNKDEYKHRFKRVNTWDELLTEIHQLERKEEFLTEFKNTA